MRFSFKNDYELLHWLDHLLKVGPDGKYIPVKDKNGNIEYNPLTGLPKYEASQQGTRVSAKRLNHMDLGIFMAHEYLVELASLVRRMQIQLELDGRVPGNSGTFSDTLDGSTNKIVLDKTLTDIIEPVAIGTTVLKVASTKGFTPFTQVTIFDDLHMENVIITAISTNTITVQALTNNYKKGAKVARSNVAIDTTLSEMGIGNWQTYKVDLVEVV